MIANCGLCLEDGEIRDSHLMPAAVYKLCRSEGRRNPHPVVTTQKAVLTSAKQVRAPFLCLTCEDRFSKKGERYVLDESARLDDSLRATIDEVPASDSGGDFAGSRSHGPQHAFSAFSAFSV